MLVNSPQTPKPPKMMLSYKRTQFGRTSLWIMVILLTAILGVYFFTQPKPLTVKAHQINRGEIIASVANTRVGTIKACRRAYLAPAAAGQLAELRVKEGERVKQRQLLMEIRNEDLKARVKFEKAQVIAQQANAEQICLLAAGARREAIRLAKLKKHNQIISEDRLDQVETNAKAQQAHCRASRQAIIVQQAQLSIAEANLEKTLVKAPFEGVIAEINAELGEFVTPSPPGIPTLPPIDLLDISCLTVSAPIDEVDAAKIRVGMSACVSLDAFAEKRCSGQVSRIAPYVLEREKQARTVEVEVKLTAAKDLAELLPGYSADIEILLERKENVLRIPTEAVMEDHYVWLIDENKQLQRRKFKAGLSNWNFIEAISGLQAGDQIVLSIGLEDLEVGRQVEIE